MAYQPETGEWAEGVYQIEEDDYVLGGAGGPDNKPLLDLANRTGYLRTAIGTVAEV
jgi:hypothetical protein